MKNYALALTPLVLSACGGGNTNTSVTNAAITCTAISALPTKPAWNGSIFTIVMENKSRGDIFGNKDAPFINALASQNAVAAGYRDDLEHPSEPNYLWLVGGNSFGVDDDADPVSNHVAVTSHLADQLDMQGLSWRGYMESMGAPCGLMSNYPYAAKHNPFVFFDDVDGWNGTTFMPSQRCNDHVVDYSTFDADLASGNVPKYVFITPNMVNDMHDGSIADGDKWLATEVPKILSSPAFNDGGVLFLTWDEGGGSPAGDDPPMIVVSPNAKAGYVSQTPFDESSYLKTVEKLLGLQTLPCGASPEAVATMDELFTVPLTTPVAQ